MAEWENVTCAKCRRTQPCTPWNDFYQTPLWQGDGRVCEACFQELVAAQLTKEQR